MKKILVIDDKQDVVDLVGYMLTARGYQVVDARSGEEGIQRARLFKPDLILCDIMMPVMSGYDVFQETRHDPALATTPFIFLTAKAGPEDLRAGMILGADDYLTKPFTDEQLIAAIETQLEKYERLKQRYEQKLAQLREGLTTILPHELRTPLTLILAHTSFLIEDFDRLDRNAIVKDLHIIQEFGQRLHRVIENLLLYVQLRGDATLGLEEPYTASVRRVATQVSSARAEAHQRTADLTLRLVDGALHMHEFHLRKIVSELVDNAFRYSRSGQQVNVGVAREGELLSLEVTDQGRGMTEEQISQIGAYIQFDRARQEQQGSGLGLTLVKRLAELYQGTFQVTSRPGAGTTVRLRLPRMWDALV